MVAVGGGLLAAFGLFALLSELDDYDQRLVGLAVTFLFVALGVAISVLNRTSRAAAGGVALSLLAVIPFTVYVFANANLFDLFSGDASSGDPYEGIRWTVTLMLGLAAFLWVVGYLFVPTRRFGAYLGAALIAIWLIPLFNLQLNAFEDTFSAFDSSVTFEPIPSDPGFDSGFDEFDSEFDSGFDEFDDPSFEDEFGQFDDDFSTFEEPEISDPSTKIGIVSLLFGVVYLGIAGWRDRKGDARMATAVLVPAILALYVGTSAISGHIGWVGRGLLAVVVGGAVLAIGLRGGRRASSWIGLVLATGGVAYLIAEPLSESARASGAVLTVVGVAIALVVGRRDAMRQDPPSDGTGTPAPSTTPSTEPTAPAPSDPSPWSQSF